MQQTNCMDINRSHLVTSRVFSTESGSTITRGAHLECGSCFSQWGCSPSLHLRLLLLRVENNEPNPGLICSGCNKPMRCDASQIVCSSCQRHFHRTRSRIIRSPIVAKARRSYTECSHPPFLSPNSHPTRLKAEKRLKEVHTSLPGEQIEKAFSMTERSDMARFRSGHQPALRMESNGSEWKLPLRGWITYRHRRQPKLKPFSTGQTPHLGD